MAERGVDHAVDLRRAGLEAVQVLQRTALHLGTQGGDFGGPLVGAGEAEYGVAIGYQLLGHGRTDPAAGAGNENTHGKHPL